MYNVNKSVILNIEKDKLEKKLRKDSESIAQGKQDDLYNEYAY